MNEWKDEFQVLVVSDVLEVQLSRSNVDLVFEYLPGVDEVLLVAKFRSYQLYDRQ